MAYFWYTIQSMPFDILSSEIKRFAIIEGLLGFSTLCDLPMNYKNYRGKVLKVSKFF